jgi:hypothetical protein
VSAAPIVTDLEALDDAQWFAEHPDRAFRMHLALGGGFRVVSYRRRDGVFLRAWLPVLPQRSPLDDDKTLEALWQVAAYPAGTPR